jgi:phenylalanyl-tRNA synthetase beta subunit
VTSRKKTSELQQMRPMEDSFREAKAKEGMEGRKYNESRILKMMSQYENCTFDRPV